MRGYILRFTWGGIPQNRVTFENVQFSSTTEALEYIKKIVGSYYTNIIKGYIIAESDTPFTDEEFEYITLTDFVA